jgi:hypothetical protein
MNIIEVAKKENIGKEYKVFLDGKDLGVWVIIEDEKNGEFDFYQKYKVLSDRYVSQLIRMEFEEVIDWAKIPVDTPIWVRDNEELDWLPRHFAKYENGIVYTWTSGKTSHTIGNPVVVFNEWKYAKLYQE